MPPKISVVIPTKDEQDAIASVIQGCKRTLERFDHEIIVVDSSKDSTPTRAAAAGAILFRQVGFGGVGEALMEGFQHARGEHIVFLDGDGTYEPADIERVIQPLLKGEVDFVNGNRFANVEKGAMPLTNMIGNKFLTWVSNVIFHTSIKDSQSGMKAFRRDLLKRMAIYERDFPICTELVAESSKLNLRMAEVGITYKRRIGKTKLSPASAGPKILWASLSMLRDYDPLLLFGGIGLVLFVVGSFIAWPVISEYLSTRSFTLVGRALVAVLCWLSGLLSIFSGIMLNAINYSVKKMEARLSKQS